MSAVAPASSNWAYIETKVRRLTASSGGSSLTSASIQQYGNNFITNTMPFSVKVDQMRSVYTFYTSPYIDRYPVDVNYNQGFRAPMYVDGIEGTFAKDREQFYLMWPKWPTRFQQAPTSLSGTITGATQANPAQITSANHGLATGAVITITGIVGMTQLNGNTYTITFVNANNFTLNGVDSTAFGAYVSGGSWSANSQSFSFTIGTVPFLSKTLTIGGLSTTGTGIRIGDDGNGNVQLETPNPQVSVPVQTKNPAVPGMYNLNTQNPGLINVLTIGTVNYVTGQIAFTLPSGISLASGELLSVYVSQYQTGLPYSMLFWNNEITIRPVPKRVHKIEIETYLTPVQFLLTTDNPILNQWADYIAYGIAIKILVDRQDTMGVQSLETEFRKEEERVLARQATEELFQRNTTIFSSSVQGQGNYWGNWGGWF